MNKILDYFLGLLVVVAIIMFFVLFGSFKVYAEGLDGYENAVNIKSFTLTKQNGIITGISGVEYRVSQKQEIKLDNYVKYYVNKLKVKSKIQTYYNIKNFIKQRVIYKNDGNQCYTAYGAMINRRATCTGYAFLARRMLTQAGIKCDVVKNSNHAWNEANFDGFKLQFDITLEDGGVR